MRKRRTLPAHSLHRSVSSSKLAQTQLPTLRLTFDTAQNPHMALTRDHLHRSAKTSAQNTRQPLHRLFFPGVKGSAFSRWNSVRERRDCPLTIFFSSLRQLTVENPAPILITEHTASFLIFLFVQLEAAKGKLAPGDGGGKAGFHWIP